MEIEICELGSVDCVIHFVLIIYLEHHRDRLQERIRILTLLYHADYVQELPHHRFHIAVTLLDHVQQLELHVYVRLPPKTAE